MKQTIHSEFTLRLSDNNGMLNVEAAWDPDGYVVIDFCDCNGKTYLPEEFKDDVFGRAAAIHPEEMIRFCRSMIAVLEAGKQQQQDERRPAEAGPRK